MKAQGHPSEKLWSIILAGGEGERVRPLIQRWLGCHKPKQSRPHVLINPSLRCLLLKVKARWPLTSEQKKGVNMATTSQDRQTKKSRIQVKEALKGSVPVREPGGQPAHDQDVLRARIERRAYELYVERGCRQGCALEDWLDAEKEILSR